MNWKEFLKPDKKKLIAFFVMLVCIFITPGLFINIYVLKNLTSLEAAQLNMNPWYVYSIIFVDIVYWYVIFCFALWIYYNMKKKK